MTLTAAEANYILENGLGSNINFMAVGTGTTVPDELDTKLVTEVYRFPVSYNTYENKIYFTSIIPGPLSIVSIKEVGLYRNGKLAKDSGQLAARKLYNLSKLASTSYALVYEYEFTGFTDLNI
jgi:hypothetical protein